MNPLNSPWNKAKYIKISDRALNSRWLAVQRHLKTTPNAYEFNGLLTIDVNDVRIYLAKKSTKFRLKSHLDWAWYTPKTIAQAIDQGNIEEYYEIMLEDQRSDPNEWPDIDFEMELKTRYAARVNRCSQLI